MPDIDVDFCIRGRDQVIRYVKEKYGADKVAQIATFGRSRRRRRSRMSAVPWAYPSPKPIRSRSLSRTEAGLRLFSRRIAQNGAAARLTGENRRARQNAHRSCDAARRSDAAFFDARRRRGAVESAAGRIPPLYVDKEGGIVTQFDMSVRRENRPDQIRFLGLKTLTLLHDCVKLIEKSKAVKLDLNNLPLDDKSTYKTLVRGQHHGRVPVGEHGHP
jgi:DNA polymerase-3 subunit alpha